MHNNIRNTILIAAALTGLVRAESKENDWAGVTALTEGTKIQVVHGNLKSAKGTLAAVSGDGIAVRTNAGEQWVPRGEVQRVSVTSVSRKKRALVGAVIGGAALATVVAIGAKSDSLDFRKGPLIAGAATGGAGAGALIGSASGGPRTVYRAPR